MDPIDKSENEQNGPIPGIACGSPWCYSLVTQEKEVNNNIVDHVKDAINSTKKDVENKNLPFLPNEMWDAVLKKASHPREVLNLSHTCFLFRDLLKESRQKIVVLHLLLNNATFIRALKKKSESEGEPEAGKALIPFREVCNDWKHVFDDHNDVLLKKYFSANARCFMEGEVLLDHECIELPFTKTVVLKSLSSLTRILEDFFPLNSACAAERLVARSLFVSYKGVGDVNIADFNHGLSQFLELVGDQIYDFYVHFGDVYKRFQASNIYILLHHWSCLLPNLRSLKVAVSSLPKHDGVDLERTIRLNPFPRLEHLQVIGKLYSISPAIFRAVVHSNQHIKRIETFSPELLNCVTEKTFPLLRLQSLAIWNLPIDIKATSTLLNPKWPLKNLYMHFRQYTLAGPLFAVLGQFRTLEQITLIGVEGAGALKMPNLKVFKGLMNEEFDNIDFLLPCKGLRMIALKISSNYHPRWFENESATEKIRFKGFFGNMHKSNIWEEFKALEVVKLWNVASAEQLNSFSYIHERP